MGVDRELQNLIQESSPAKFRLDDPLGSPPAWDSAVLLRWNCTAKPSSAQEREHWTGHSTSAIKQGNNPSFILVCVHSAQESVWVFLLW